VKEMKIVPLKVIQTKERLITPSGLALVGALLKKTGLGRLLNRLGKPKDVKHQNSNCVFGYVGLLCQGKTDYEDMREMQEDPSFFCQALQINTIASAETVRQRMDYLGFDIAASDIVMEESANMLKSVGIEPSPAYTGHVALDVDVSVHDNSKTKREGVERTYKGIDGYAPIYAYIGEEGYVCNAELREGNCHSQCDGTVEFLADTLRLAKQLTSKKLLARMDSGNDALDNIKLFVKENVDYIIKRNLRGESVEDWLETAQKYGKVVPNSRQGKTVYIGSVLRDRGLEHPIRIVFKVTERTMCANGQLLMIPDIDVQTWWTSLECSEDDVIRLYREHATCEQFHSEIKSDIGLERFPSGSFDTNAAILKLAALALNILRIIGHTALDSDVKLTRHDVRRLRAKTVMKRLILIAGHVVSHARQTFLGLGRSNIWRDAFVRIYTAFA
jgi:hypothetical protein